MSETIQIQADWAQTDSTQIDFIKNKPNLYEEWWGTQAEYDAILVKDPDKIYNIKTVYYTVSISAGSNGSVTVNGVAGNYSDSVPAGTVLTIEGTGDTGYDFDEWSDGNTDNPRTITVNSDITLTAAFEEVVVLPDYFYVEDESGSDNTLSIVKNDASAPDITVYKSTDRVNWVSMGTTDTTAITATVPANGKLYLKATSNVWAYGDTKYNKMFASGNHNIGGNIMSLLNSDNFENTTITTGNTFYYLFNGDTKLVSTGNLTLPSNVKTDCYNHMFYGCTSLTTAPVLPATTLEAGCYNYMFYRCTSLTAAPALPALNAPRWCYGNMFYGCTSLTTAPALPATTIGDNAYNNMFNGCTALTTAPALPATTLSGSCYREMFKGCTGLTTAPTLPATTLASDCYYNMFNGCTSLTTAPALPATTLAVNCYRGMFIGCTSLVTVPTDLLPVTTLTDSCYQDMFSGCTSLTNTPTLPATTLTNNCYRGMFVNCSSLTTAPALPATTLATYCYYSMFQYCTGLTTAPVLPATTLVGYCYRTMFEYCRNLNNVTVYADDISAENCTHRWLYNVSRTGDFYNLGSATYTTGENGIPSGWTEHTSL